MTDVFQAVVSEPSAATATQYRNRVRYLAAVYLLVFVASIAGECLIVWKGQLLVTLTQRSNVETLTLLFFLAFFGYVALISLPGALGAVRLFYYVAIGTFAKDGTIAERRKASALGEQSKPLDVAVNIRVHERTRPDEPIEIDVADEAGRVGTLRIDGARWTFVAEHRHTSNNVFAFVEEQLNDILKLDDAHQKVNVLAWATIDDEQVEQFLAMVKFARNLERHLGAKELWPQIELTRAHIDELERRLSSICPALREEGFLPDWEYTAEHKLPIIPEPLGFASISRSETRADPLVSMGLAAAVVVASVFILAMVIIFPPWVPG
jgi:hypothetical protein